MTLQTQQIHVAYAEKTWIGRAVWSMTTRTTFRLYGYMLEYEGTLFVSMALVTDCIATWECPDLPERGRAMCVVAIATLNQSLIDAVTIRPRKISFGRSVTAITQIWLCPHQQMLWFLGMMRRVAI